MDSLYWGPFRVSQLLAAVSCFAAAVVLVVLAFRNHNPEKLYVNQIVMETEVDAITAEEAALDLSPSKKAVPAEEEIRETEE